jgi:triacylglycerol lipase
MTVSLDSLFISLIVVLTRLCSVSTAHVVPLEVSKAPENITPGRQISQELFDSIEELAHIVDIAYCIGTTGIRKPFQCLSHCGELKGFELINVRFSTDDLPEPFES